MIKWFSLLFFTLFLWVDISAQELNCQVSVNSQQVDGADKRRFETMQTAIYEFMNTRQWTNRKFKPEERIECSVFISFDKSTSGDLYKGTIQIQSRRPIFNSSYNSPLLNLKDDKFSFEWVEYDPLNFDVNTFSSNLTSVLAYYAYVIIGMDFDSYSLLGGSEYFNNAQTVVNNAQNSGYSGWKSFEKDDNRYWFLENILNSRYEDFRTFNYRYHRLGFDLMFDNLAKGRTEVLNSLKLLQNVHRVKPNLQITKSILDAKRDEFIGLFTDAQANEKSQALAIFMNIDPGNASKYQKINTGK
jgi:hypothetical protein